MAARGEALREQRKPPLDGQAIALEAAST